MPKFIVKNPDGTYLKNAKFDTVNIKDAKKFSSEAAAKHFCGAFGIAHVTIIPVKEGGEENVDKE